MHDKFLQPVVYRTTSVSDEELLCALKLACHCDACQYTHTPSRGKERADLQEDVPDEFNVIIIQNMPDQVLVHTMHLHVSSITSLGSMPELLHVCVQIVGMDYLSGCKGMRTVVHTHMSSLCFFDSVRVPAQSHPGSLPSYESMLPSSGRGCRGWILASKSTWSETWASKQSITAEIWSIFLVWFFMKTL